MKLLKINTNQYKANFKKHLNEHLLDYNDGYCENINDLLLCFNSECNHENDKNRYPFLTDRIAQYLRGLPYGFNFAYEHEILNFACLVHELEQMPEDKIDIIRNNFYNHCAYMITKLGNKEIINKLH